jgi:hypothetical protein
MRKSVVFAVAALAFVGWVATANASLVVRDTFTDSPLPKNLTSHTPEIGGAWTAFSAAGSTPIQIVADHPPIGADGSAYLSQGSGSREDDATAFAGGEIAGADSKYWAGFCVKVTGTNPLSTVYFAGFKDAGTANYAARVGVVDNPDVTNFSIALFSGSTAVAATWPTPLLFGDWHRIVTAYTFNSGLQEMWVDPNPLLGPYDVGQVTPISYTGYASTAVQTYAFRQATVSPTAGVSQQTIDNLAVGNNVTDWYSVAAPCPEPASLVLLCLAGLMIRRRK